MMSQCRRDEVILVGIRPWNEELGHGIAHRCLLDVLAESPPAVVVRLLELLVGAVEERNVRLHPLP